MATKSVLDILLKNQSGSISTNVVSSTTDGKEQSVASKSYNDASNNVDTYTSKSAMEEKPSVSNAAKVQEPPVDSSLKYLNNSSYAGDAYEDITPVRGIFEKMDFKDPATFVCYFNEKLRNGVFNLHAWQVEELEKIGNAKATANNPYKLCLVTCNGSGKDAFIIASTVVWFAVCKIRSRSIVTSSSGVQLTSQTEGYIRSLCQVVNEYWGQEIFRIRQRYITCRLSGSEIRLFATDEAGKAEGYHPMDPDAEMLIVVNEAKSVSEEIHGALRRCTGYNYWLEISSPGETAGFFYKAFCNWPNVRVVNTYMCPHLSASEREQDKIDLGEDSALFRSKHLALFTSTSAETVIAREIVDSVLKLVFDNSPYTEFDKRVGIDLAAGGDENCVTMVQGVKILKEIAFRETDTEITADRIDHILSYDLKLQKTHDFIFADDGGVGKAIIDKLVRRGWRIHRVLNQSAAINKSQFGNRGAENWYRVCRLIQEGFIDLTGASNKTIEQLTSRKYRKVNTSAKLYLESKADARANGRPSPDRADALVLCYSGVSLNDYIDVKEAKNKKPEKKEKRFTSMQELMEYYENEEVFSQFDDDISRPKHYPSNSSRSFGSLNATLN